MPGIRSANSEELFDVVDEQDRVVGQAARWDVHARNLLHRAVHVLVYDEAGRFFLQRRSLSKDSFPGCWDASCTGHLDAGEDYETAARRELGEELGWHDVSQALRQVTKLMASPETGYEFIEVFLLGPTSGPFVLHPEEIIEGRWADPRELGMEMRMSPEKFSGAFRFLWEEYGVKIAELLLAAD
jgi:isopentenyl-diphosphate Delta-isomerase